MRMGSLEGRGQGGRQNEGKKGRKHVRLSTAEGNGEKLRKETKGREEWVMKGRKGEIKQTSKERVKS